MTTTGIENNYSKMIIKTYTFNKPNIVQELIEDAVYDNIIMQNTDLVGYPGQPGLPVYNARLLLPPKTKVDKINIHPGERILLGSGFNIKPIGESVPISMINITKLPKPNTDIYTLNNIFPDKSYTKFNTYSYRGYNIIILGLNPIQYIPSTGELYYFKEISISIQTTENEKTNLLLRNIRNDEINLLSKIDNPSNIIFYKKFNNILTSNKYELLILTSEELKNSFEPLKEFHNNENIRTEIKTLKDISFKIENISPEDIRDFIRDEYLKNGIEYLLIGGDTNVIPVKNLYLGNYLNTDYFGPSDLYYSCLDGTFNYDNDGRWGEPNDGENGEDVDLVAEVYVGRACVNNSSEVNNFIEKTINYIELDYNYNVSLLLGEELSSQPLTWGADYMDELINESSSNSYSTIGIPPEDYRIEKLYDRDSPNNIWSKFELINKLNNDVQIISHIGHTSYDFSMRLDKDDISLLNNAKPFFVYSQGCHSGGFDTDDCFAEYLTVKTRYGAFAGIWNARYGWFSLGGTNGASQRLHREFWDAVFGEEITNIGKANQDSKEDLLHIINYPYIRWCSYQLNLLGDPTLQFNNKNMDNKPPTDPLKPSKEKIEGIYHLKTVSLDSNGDDIYYKWDFGDGSYSNWIGPYRSHEEIEISYNWSKIGIYKVRVKARDEHRTESNWSDYLLVRVPLYNIDLDYSHNFIQQIINFLKECIIINK